jgi:hypothetical protein
MGSGRPKQLLKCGVQRKIILAGASKTLERRVKWLGRSRKKVHK